MLIKVISMAFDSATGNFDDSQLREFLKDKEIISIQEHFFIRNEVPYLTMIVKYFPYRQEVDPQLAPRGKRDESWRELIEEQDMGIFNRLREWRGAKSRAEGVPPYVLFTNKQFADLLKLKPKTLADLERIDGVGKAKVEKYGQNILEITNQPSESKGAI